MTIKELNQRLYKINDVEERYRKGMSTGLKTYFSHENPEEKWVINSAKFMGNDEVISIHKHDRFVRFEQHRHDYLEMIYVYSGAIRQQIEGEVFTVCQGEIFLLDMNVEHSVYEAGEEDIGINILIKKEFFDSFFMKQISSNDVISNFVAKALYGKKDIKQYIYFQTGENRQILDFMQQLLMEYYEQRNGVGTAIRAYMLLIFNELFRSYEKHLEKPIVHAIDESISVEMLNYVNEHFKTLSLTTMAKDFNYHPDYFGKVIKKRTGSSLTALVKERKLDYAKYLLVNTSMPVSDIVTEIGYSNMSYFYKQFKQTFGATPDQVRKDLEKKGAIF